MKCEEVMTRDPRCCSPTDTVALVAKWMKTEDVGCVPVCHDRHVRKLVGIVTDRDLAIRVVAEGRDPNSTTVQEIMTREPFTCYADDILQVALQGMELYQVRRIPVVDVAGNLVGIIAQADVATRLAQPETTAEVVERISMPSPMQAA